MPNLFTLRDQFRGRQFFHGPGQGARVSGWFKACLYCVLYFYYASSTSGHKALDPGGWGTLVYKVECSFTCDYLMIRFRLYNVSRKITDVTVFFCILSQDRRLQLVSLPVKVTSIIWLRRYLLGFYTVKLHGEVTGEYEVLHFSLAFTVSFSITWHFLPELLQGWGLLLSSVGIYRWNKRSVLLYPFIIFYLLISGQAHGVIFYTIVSLCFYSDGHIWSVGTSSWCFQYHFGVFSSLFWAPLFFALFWNNFLNQFLKLKSS